MNPLKKIIVWILILESRLIIAKYKPFIVAITGSVGKTTTKDAIYSVLKNPANCRADGNGICHVRKAEKSMNSEIGLPLTVIGVSNAWYSLSGWLSNIWSGFKLILKRQEYPDCLILEVGADHPGDIRNIVSWLKPDITVITRVSKTPVHVEFFSSPEEVFEEKALLAEAVKPGGTLILFGDDDKVMSLKDRVKDRNVKVMSFGTGETSEIRSEDVKITYAEKANIRVPVGFSFNIKNGSAHATVTLQNIIGNSYMYPLLAAAAVGIARGMAFEAILQGLNAYEAPKGRMNIIHGISDSTIIDDTYNSSPDAVRAALGTLNQLESSGTKIAILGDMMELGSYSSEEHRAIGREVADMLKSGGRLITVGQRSRVTADEAMKNVQSIDSVHACDSAYDATQYVVPLVKAGDIILVKGSQSVRMERIVKALMREPDMAGELLVRQEKEWLEKA